MYGGMEDGDDFRPEEADIQWTQTQTRTDKINNIIIVCPNMQTGVIMITRTIKTIHKVKKKVRAHT